MTRLTTGSHPGLDTLAELSEGLLEPRPAGRVRSHVESCQSCADQLAAITPAMTLAASSLRALERLDTPADVTAAMSARLAAEPPVTAPAPRRGGQASVATIHDTGRHRAGPNTSTGHRGRIRGTTVATAAAVTVLVVVASATLYGLINRSAGSAPDSSTATESPTSTSLLLAASTRNYTDSTVRWWAPRLVAGEGLSKLQPDQPLPAAVSPQAGSAASTVSATASSVDPGFQRSLQPSPLASVSAPPSSSGAAGEALPGAIATAVPTADDSTRTGPQQGGADQDIGRLRQAEALRNCIAQIAPSNDASPLVVEFARYRDDQVAVVILPVTSHTMEVWVVGPACGVAGGDVRYMATVSRPAH